MVERAVFDRRDLNPNEKLVLCYLAMRANREDTCWPSYQTMGRDCGFSRRTAIRVVQDLEAKGLVSRTTRRNEDGDYTSNLFRLFSAEEPLMGPPEGGGADLTPPLVTVGHRGGADMTPPLVTAGHLNKNQLESESTNHVVESIPAEIQMQAQTLVQAAKAKGVEVGNEHAYRQGIIRNLMVEQQASAELQQLEQQRAAIRARRESCSTCSGMGLVDVPGEDNVVTGCPDCRD